MDANYLKTKHQSAVPYDQYIASGKPEQQKNWQQIYDQTQCTANQKATGESFVRRINIIAFSGIWCGDCVQQGPLIQRIAETNPAVINLRWLDRDQHPDLQELVRINAGDRVPVLIFCSEDYEMLGWYGDRTLSRYRAIAQRQFGASCALPGAEVDPIEQTNTLQDWFDQIERVHLLLRLSGRLRQMHGD